MLVKWSFWGHSPVQSIAVRRTQSVQSQPDRSSLFCFIQSGTLAHGWYYSHPGCIFCTQLNISINTHTDTCKKCVSSVSLTLVKLVIEMNYSALPLSVIDLFLSQSDFPSTNLPHFVILEQALCCPPVCEGVL